MCWQMGAGRYGGMLLSGIVTCYVTQGLMIITSNHVTKQIAGAFVVKQVHDLWNALEWYSSN